MRAATSRNLRRAITQTPTFEIAEGSSTSLTLDPQSGVVGVADAIGEPGRYTLAALATSPDFVGAARLAVVLRLLSAFTLDPLVGVPPEARERTRFAPAGYAGSVAFYAAATPGATLRAPDALPDGFTLGADDAAGAEFVSPAGFTLFLEDGRIPNEGDAASAAFEITATYRHFEPETIPLLATVSAIVRPQQALLSAVYAAPFSHSPSLPDGLLTGATLSIAGTLRAEGEGGFVLENDLVIPAAVPPDVGTYTISLAVDRGDLLAIVTLDIPAEISPAALGADYELPGLTLANVTVAAGYGGTVYAVALAAADAIAALPSSDDVDAGFTLALSADERTATLSLDSALDGGTVLEGDFPLTIIRQKNGAADANYLTLPQTLYATVTALPLIAVASLYAQAPYDINPAIYDFRGELGGAYAAAAFGKEGGSAELEVSEEGIVSAATTLAVGGYTLIATLTADAYLGTARATLELTIAPRIVSPDEVVSAGGRDVTLDAAVGFFGAAYAIPVEEGYTLRNPAFTPAGAGAYDAANTLMVVPEAGAIVAGAAQTIAMEADVACLTRGPCDPLRLTIAAELRPIGDGGQARPSEIYLNGFARDLNLPTGYASADGKTGLALTVAGVNGLSAKSLANVSLAIAADAGTGADQLVYAPFPVPDNAARFIQNSENNSADAKAGQYYAALAAAMRAHLRFEPDYYDVHLAALDALQVQSALVNAAALSGFSHTLCLGVSDPEAQVACYFEQVAEPTAAEIGNALAAGEYTVTIALSQADADAPLESLLGTVYLEVTAEVLARGLDPAEFEFDAPAEAVVVAAGAGAVGAELAALSLTAGADADAIATLPAEFPAGLSATPLADSRGATYYLAAALAGGEEIARTATLIVTLVGNPNYTALEQTAALRISALLQPAPVEGEGLLGPNGEAFDAGGKAVFELRIGDYANATFARDSESDAELLIGANGQVSVRAGGISLPGVYHLFADATSPDYAGAARLEAVLTVRAPDAPDAANTIPLAERRQNLLAVAGYAGSVAFYAAGGAGAVLQTPASAPNGFNLGAGGLKARFASPEGFTLFVEEGQLANAGIRRRRRLMSRRRLPGLTRRTLCWRSPFWRCDSGAGGAAGGL